ncbi:N-6 DNA methylase [Larkinella harenae]
MAKTIQQLSRRHGTYNVFADTWAMSSYALSNAVDLRNQEAREAEYMRTVKKYDKSEANEIAHLFAMLAMELTEHPRDVLGELFHELEIHNEHAGQFFTPWNLCQMMAKMNTAGQAVQEIIDRKGFVSVHEPACGSGAMVIAMAGALADEEINYQKRMHVTAIDIDIRCVHMAYTQFSLLHIPATVIHGNALSLEQWSVWHTPAHILDGWDRKLRRQDQIEVARQAIEMVEEVTKPEPKIDRKPDLKPEPKKPNVRPVGQQLTLF